MLVSLLPGAHSLTHSLALTARKEGGSECRAWASRYCRLCLCLCYCWAVCPVRRHATLCRPAGRQPASPLVCSQCLSLLAPGWPYPDPIPPATATATRVPRRPPVPSSPAQPAIAVVYSTLVISSCFCPPACLTPHHHPHPPPDLHGINHKSSLHLSRSHCRCLVSRTSAFPTSSPLLSAPSCSHRPPCPPLLLPVRFSSPPRQLLRRSRRRRVPSCRPGFETPPLEPGSRVPASLYAHSACCRLLRLCGSLAGRRRSIAGHVSPYRRWRRWPCRHPHHLDWLVTRERRPAHVSSAATSTSKRVDVDV